jgi:hypothetical protein
MEAQLSTPRPCCPGGKPLPFPCTYMPLKITEPKDSCEIILLKEILGIDELQMDLILHMLVVDWLLG